MLLYIKGRFLVIQSARSVALSEVHHVNFVMASTPIMHGKSSAMMRTKGGQSPGVQNSEGPLVVPAMIAVVLLNAWI